MPVNATSRILILADVYFTVSLRTLPCGALTPHDVRESLFNFSIQGLAPTLTTTRFILAVVHCTGSLRTPCVVNNVIYVVKD